MAGPTGVPSYYKPGGGYEAARTQRDEGMRNLGGLVANTAYDAAQFIPQQLGRAWRYGQEQLGMLSPEQRSMQDKQANTFYEQAPFIPPAIKKRMDYSSKTYPVTNAVAQHLTNIPKALGQDFIESGNISRGSNKREPNAYTQPTYIGMNAL